MAVNNLQKDAKNSDVVIRGDAIKILTDMTANLKDLFPFLLEIIQSGLHDKSEYVVQVSLFSLVKLFASSEIQLDDYQEQILEAIVQNILLKYPLLVPSEQFSGI